MTIVFVMQVLLWPSYGSSVNLSFPDPHIYKTYEECAADAKLLQDEADKLQGETGRFYYAYTCRPEAAYAKNGT